MDDKGLIILWGWICGMILPQTPGLTSGTEVTNKDETVQWVVRPQITLIINDKSAKQNKNKNQ